MSNQPSNVIGTPAQSMTTDEFSKKFGRTNTKAGSKGEQILFGKLRKKKDGWLPWDVPLFCSLIVPGKKSDIDFAVCLGDKVLLIDAKMYRQDTKFFWNLGDSTQIMRNFTKYKNHGEPVTMSRSMTMARDIIARKLPNHTVESVVILTNDPNNPNAIVPNVHFLDFPGKVKAINDNQAQRYITKFFKGQQHTAQTAEAEEFLSRIVQ